MLDSLHTKSEYGLQSATSNSLKFFLFYSTEKHSASHRCKKTAKMYASSLESLETLRKRCFYSKLVHKNFFVVFENLPISAKITYVQKILHLFLHFIFYIKIYQKNMFFFAQQLTKVCHVHRKMPLFLRFFFLFCIFCLFLATKTKQKIQKVRNFANCENFTFFFFFFFSAKQKNFTNCFRKLFEGGKTKKGGSYRSRKILNKRPLHSLKKV